MGTLIDDYPGDLDLDLMGRCKRGTKWDLVDGLFVPRVSGGASSPAFGTTLRMGRCVITTSATTTDKTGATTTNISDILTGVAAGTQIYEVTVQYDGDAGDGIVLIFLHNGTDYRLHDEFDHGNPAAGSTTVTAYREARKYENLYLPSGSWKIAAGMTVATSAGNLNVWAAGADL